jgi:hypothetical protein
MIHKRTDELRVTMNRSMRRRVAAWFLALMWGGLSADAATARDAAWPPEPVRIARHLVSPPEAEPIASAPCFLRPTSASPAALPRQGADID